jgi:hypothetical protein
MYQLMETKIIVRCRQVDLETLKQIVPDAEREFQSKTSKNCTVLVDSTAFLPPPPGTDPAQYWYKSVLEEINS